MLVYDATSSSATRQADQLRPLLPVGIPVIPMSELPDRGTLRLSPAVVAGTIAWVEVDGNVYQDHRAKGHALVTCGGKPAAWGWAIRTPVVGGVIAKAWRP